LKAGAITTNEIAAEAVTADKIAANSITLNKLSSSAIDAIIADAKGYTDEVISAFGEYLTFDATNGLTIGSNETAMKTVIDSEEIGFYNGSNKVAYINQNTFMMNSAEVERSL
jgi:hypothetical protein